MIRRFPIIVGKGAAEGAHTLKAGIHANLIQSHFPLNDQAPRVARAQHVDVTELNRTTTDSRMSERALREIYLKPFEIAVKTAQPWLVMTSYNKVNGVETAESYELITNILRGEWGFEGLVTTDWSNNSTQYKEILAGNDFKMRDGDEQGLLNAYRSGTLTREDLEVSVARVLTLIMKTNAVDRGFEENAPIVIPADQAVIFTSVDHIDRSGSIGMEICQDTTGGYNTTNTKSTGGWQNWSEASQTVTVTLTKGVHELRLEFTGEQFNLNTIQIAPAS